ncbi:hypothetical protein [Mycolicibacterium thermoresistibile]
MTVITTRPLSDSTDSLLRFALRADATVCGGLGLFIAFAADPLSRATGLSAAGQFLTGAALAGYGLLLYVLAAAAAIRRIGIGIVVANVAFTAGALTVLALGWLGLTGFGTTAALAFTALTVALAYLQYLGVRRLA